MSNALPRAVATLVAVWCVTGLAIATGSVSNIATCDEWVREQPSSIDAYKCYVDYGRDARDQETPRRRLEALLAIDSTNPLAQLHLARVIWLRDVGQAQTLLRSALASFRETGNDLGEAWARAALFKFAVVQRRFDGPEADGETVLQLARATGDIELLASVRYDIARAVLNRGDPAGAWLEIRRFETEPEFDRIPPGWKATYYNLASILAGRLNMPEASLRYARREREIGESQGSDLYRARGLNNELQVLAGRVARGEIDRAEVQPLVAPALELMLQEKDLIGELEVRSWAAKVTEPEEAMEHLRIIAKHSRSNPFCRHLASHAMTQLGAMMIKEQPGRAEEAFDLIRAGVKDAEVHADAYMLLDNLLVLVRARFELGPRERAIELGLSTLDLIETLSDRQSAEELSARLVAQFATVYYELIGLLLDTPGSTPLAEDQELAFHLSERLRARRLRHHLDRIGEAPDSSVAHDRKTVLERISKIQLELLVGDLVPTELRRRASELQRLELDEQALRGELRRDGQNARQDRAFKLATLQEVLGDHEAILSFLMPTSSGSEARVFVATHDRLRIYVLEASQRIADAARLFGAAVGRRDGSETPGAIRLYDDLLDAPLRDLPETVERLIVLPDGPLHQLPFDALRRAIGEPLLVERFEVTVAPSAGVWMRLRELAGASTVAAAVALVLADPAPPRERRTPGALRGLRSADWSVGRLPHTRDEGRAALRALGGRGDLLTGAQASEAFIKTADFDSYRLLHIAAHAVVDPGVPARSAVVLAPGDSVNDGLLQSREIIDLDLRGALVTLSACRTARGEALRGEGVMGLARSFFEAGASTVVGSLWPVRDEETANLMSSFYRHLAEGDSPSRAMVSTKREQLERGWPAAAWSGFVVLGAADRPIQHPEFHASSRSLPMLAAMMVLALVLAVVLYVLWRVRAAASS